MKDKNLPELDLVLYHNDVPVGVFKPDYMGLLGIHVAGCSLNFKKGTALEIEILGPDKTCVDDNRIPVLVSSRTENGLGLRLEHYNSEYLERWRSVLSGIFSFSKYQKSDNNAVAA
jgi:hypothetical protein